MMEIPEIIKALKFCISQTDHTCYEEMEECPYSNCLIDCQDRLMKDASNALEKLNCTVPKDKPLTLDELRKMGSNPIWISEKGNESQDARSLWQQFAYEEPKTGIIALWEFGYEVENEYKISDYGKTWIAYASKPEGAKTNELE